jgi:hypothetical protein
MRRQQKCNKSQILLAQLTGSHFVSDHTRHNVVFSFSVQDLSIIKM